MSNSSNSGRGQESASDLINVEEARKAREALMGAIARGDLLICGMRLDTIMGYVGEIRQRGQYTVERQLEDLVERERLEARIRELEAVARESHSDE